MIKALFTIRLKQIFRELISIGFIRLLVLIILIGFAGFYLFIKSSDELTAKYLSFGVLAAIFLLHMRRKDKRFLVVRFSNYRFIYLVEYAAISTPILSCLAIHQQYKAIMILLFGLPFIILFNFKVKFNNLNTKLQECIPAKSFEWKAGVRRSLFVLVPVWGIALFTSFFIGSVPVAMLIIGIAILGFYEEFESVQILMSQELSPTKLIFQKIKTQTQLFTIITAPLMLAFIVFNYQHWYIPIIEYGIFVSLGAYAIMTKYAFYSPNSKSAAAQTFIAIGILGGLIPVFLPVVWGLTIWFYYKSINNLDFYLNDYNK